MSIIRYQEVPLSHETGSCGFSASRYFLNLGWNVLVVNPADVPKLDKQNYQKTDKIDCRSLAKKLHAGQLKGIYIPDEAQDLLKSLLRQCAETSKQLRVIKSNIKGWLLDDGIEIPKEFDNQNWTKAFLQWLQQISWTTN